MLFKAASVPMGNSIFVTWPQIDNLFDAWAKSYFGEHVNGSGERDDTDCFVAVVGLRDTDEEKFSLLFDKYDRDRDYDPYYEFCTGEQAAILPDCISRGVISEAFKEFGMNSVGKFLAISDGVFLMENELNCMDFVVPQFSVNLEVGMVGTIKNDPDIKKDLRGKAFVITELDEQSLYASCEIEGKPGTYAVAKYHMENVSIPPEKVVSNPSLSDKIQSASTRAAASNPTSNAQVRDSELEI